MTAVSDSIIFRNIFSQADVSEIWSDERRTLYYLQFEASLAKVQAGLEIIPSRAARAIVQHCTLNIIDWAKLREQTELIGYPVLPVVKQLVARVNDTGGSEEEKLGEWAHWGATTQDVTDTATILQLRDTLVWIETLLNKIIGSLSDLGAQHRSTPMAARSNLQQAVPMSFGFKMARLLATFVRHLQRLDEVRNRLLVVEFGGAAGTLATLSPNGKDDIGMQCQAALAKDLGLGVPDIAWHAERDRIVEVGHFFTLVTGTCAKFAFDLKLMMQTEVGEASEPYVQHRGSSSTMPQKRNPIASAYITAAAATVKNLANSLADAMVEDHERSTGPWEIEWIVLPQICTLTSACLKHVFVTLDGLEVHEGKMQENLSISKGTIVSEAVMMALGSSLGRQRAHDLVYDLCHQAMTSGRPLVDLLDESEDIKLDRPTLEKLCSPREYLGLSEAMTDKVLKLADAALK